MNKFLTKNWAFSLLWVLVVAVILHRIIPPSIDKVVKLVITKNNVSIADINQPRNVQLTKVVWVDKLNLRVKERFSHPTLGNIAGYNDDFFVDIDHEVETLKAGQYRFMVGSDDGFNLSVDGKKLCEHPRDRPFSVQACFVQLQPGKHQVHITYFQGYGNSGLTVQYAYANQKERWFGENSDAMKF